MKILVGAVIALFAATPAFAQSVGEQSGANAVLGVSPTTEDFVLQAAQSDMFEIQSSELIRTTADDKVKSFAAQMIEAHNKTSDQLKAAVAGAVKASIPTDMSSSQKSMLEGLKQEKPEDLAEEYIDDQVSAHKNAVSLFQRYADGGDNAELKTWAAKTLPDLKHHLEMAQALDK